MPQTLTQRLIDYLRKSHGLKTTRAASKVLGINEATLSVYKKTDPKSEALMKMTSALIKDEVGRARSGLTSLNISEIISDYVQDTTGVTRRRDVASFLRMTESQLAHYISKNDNGYKATRKMIGALVEAAVTQRTSGLINPIIEYKKINPARYKSVYRLRPTADKTDELEHMLANRKGVYIFYDSMGAPFYIGKAKRTDLYREICARLATKSIEIIGEGCRREKLEQGDIARFLSAYEVSEPLIGVVESFLIRCSANVNENIRMEEMTNRT